MTKRSDLAQRFLDLHRKGTPLLLANAWDIGSARVFASLGFEALATTSLGYAGTLGRRDGRVTLDESLAHAADLVRATSLPVNADLEDCFADSLDGIADTVRRAAQAGLAGCSIEDYSRTEKVIHSPEVATERVAAAVDAAPAGKGLVLTARAENHLRGQTDLADTIARLQSFQEAGADVLYAPGLTRIQDIETVVRSVDRPLNVLFHPNGPDVATLARAGVARISVGSAFYTASLAGAIDAAREWLERGTNEFWSQSAKGMATARETFE